MGCGCGKKRQTYKIKLPGGLTIVKTSEAAAVAYAAKHPGASGFRLVADGMEAFALRGYSARSAGRSLDIVVADAGLGDFTTG